MIDLYTRKMAQIEVRDREVCVYDGSEKVMEWLGFDRGRCIAADVGAHHAILKAGDVYGEDMMVMGYVLPDTLLILDRVYTLISYDGYIQYVPVYFDVRRGQYVVYNNNRAVPLMEAPEAGCVRVALVTTCVMVGSLVDTGVGYVKIVAFSTVELYSQWARDVATHFKEGAAFLAPIRMWRGHVEAYERLIARLQADVTAVHADTATLFSRIIEEYTRVMRTFKELEKVVKEEPGGPPGPPRRPPGPGQ